MKRLLLISLLLALLSPGGSRAAELTLVWVDNSDNEQGFIVERSLDGSSWLPIWDLPADSTTYTDGDLPGETEIFYRVKAYNVAGSSGYSNVASGMTSSDRLPADSGPLTISFPGQLTNISARGLISVGSGQVIGGFTVEGDSIVVLIRAVGPTIGNPPFEVPNAIADPQITLTTLDGTVIQSNDNWSGSAIVNASAAVGAFPLSTGSKDAALIVNLPAGSYTVRVSGVGGSEGVGLLEIYHVR